MNTLKPLLVVAVLVGIGYGVYTRINSGPGTPPPGAPENWNATPVVQMSGDGNAQNAAAPWGNYGRASVQPGMPPFGSPAVGSSPSPPPAGFGSYQGPNGGSSAPPFGSPPAAAAVDPRLAAGSADRYAGGPSGGIPSGAAGAVTVIGPGSTAPPPYNNAPPGNAQPPYSSGPPSYSTAPPPYSPAPPSYSNAPAPYPPPSYGGAAANPGATGSAPDPNYATGSPPPSYGPDGAPQQGQLQQGQLPANDPGQAPAAANPAAPDAYASAAAAGAAGSIGATGGPNGDPGANRYAGAAASGGLAAAPTDSQAGHIGPAANANQPVNFAAAMDTARRELEAGRLPEALQQLSAWYDDPRLAATEQQQLNELLDQVAGTVVYSTQHLLEPPYEVQPGERLEDIADRYNVPWQLLAKVNGLEDPHALHAGERLKVVRGPFNALVNVDKRQLTLSLNGSYAGRFAIGIGRERPPQEGSYAVTAKLTNPTYHGLDRTIEANDPTNPLGERWIGLENQFSIHGTNDPESIGHTDLPGCISLGPRDVDDVFDILGAGSKVIIRR